MKLTQLFIFGLLLLVLVGGQAYADTLALKDGRFVEGVKIQKIETGYKLLYKNGEVLVPEPLVKDYFIEGDNGFEPRNDEEKAKVEKGLVPFEGKWIPKAERASLMNKRSAEKKRKIEDLKAHREWRNRYTSKSTNFEFEYTIDPEVFDNLKNLMETYYSVFTKKWGITRSPKIGRLKVCLYHNYDNFLQVSGAPRGVIGYYLSSDVPLDLNFFHDRVDFESTIEVMFHETNHYLTHLIDLSFSYPHNIGEAMAEYYGASHWDPVKKEMTVGHILEGRLTEVQTDIQGGEWKSLESYLKNELDYDDYTWGWSFVHFMMETPKYAPKFRAFFLGLAQDKNIKRIDRGARKTVEGDEILRAFKEHFAIKDIKILEKEWHDYVKNLKLKTHRGYEEAARAAQNTGQNIKAKRYFKLAVEKGSQNATVYSKYADILSGEGKFQEASDLLRKAMDLDPLNGELYANLGRMMKRQGQSDEGKKMIALALEIDPDNRDILIDQAMEKIGNDINKDR